MDDLEPEFGLRTPKKRAGEAASAAAVLPLLLELLPGTKSLVQVGFGDGAWLAEAQRLGVAEVHGIDGPWAAVDSLLVAEEQVTIADTRRQFGADKNYDLAVCLEYGEHLPDSRAASFIADLVRLAPVVAFSAAIPGQGGRGHVNEQWPSYWAAHFAAVDYRLVDALRPQLWDAPGMPAYLAQNLLIAVDERRLSDYPRLAVMAAGQIDGALSLVHPRTFEGERQRLSQPGIRESTALLRRALARRASRRR